MAFRGNLGRLGRSGEVDDRAVSLLASTMPVSIVNRHVPFELIGSREAFLTSRKGTRKWPFPCIYDIFSFAHGSMSFTAHGYGCAWSGWRLRRNPCRSAGKRKVSRHCECAVTHQRQKGREGGNTPGLTMWMVSEDEMANVLPHPGCSHLNGSARI